MSEIQRSHTATTGQLIKHQGLDLSGPIATVLRVNHRVCCQYCRVGYNCVDVVFGDQQQRRTMCCNCLYRFCDVLDEMKH